MLRAAKAGTQVIIPYREEDEKRHLKVTGDLGQIVSMVSVCRHIYEIFTDILHCFEGVGPS